MSIDIQENKRDADSKLQRVTSEDGDSPPTKRDFFAFLILEDEQAKEIGRISNLEGTGIKPSLIREEHARVRLENADLESEKIIWKMSTFPSMNWVVYATELHWKLFLLVDDNCRPSEVNALLGTIERLVGKLRDNDYSTRQIKGEMQKLLEAHFKKKRGERDSHDKIQEIKDKLEMIIQELDRKKGRLAGTEGQAQDIHKEVDQLLKLAENMEEQADTLEKESKGSNTLIIIIVLFGVALLVYVFVSIYLQINSSPEGGRKLLSSGVSPFVFKRAAEYLVKGLRERHRSSHSGHKIRYVI